MSHEPAGNGTAPGDEGRAAILEVEGLDVGYGALQVLDQVSVRVREGERLALLGHNGSGKSTLLKAVYGRLEPWAGAIRFRGEPLDGLSTRERIARGMGYVAQLDMVFRDLTVRENLLVAASADRAQLVERPLDRALDIFPDLERLLPQTAGLLSGGEQRMLGVAMTLIRAPRVLLLDEPSVGLSPVATERLYARLAEIASERGLTIVLAEQNVSHALEWAQRTVILRAGRVSEDLPAATLRGLPRAELARHL